MAGGEGGLRGLGEKALPIAGCDRSAALHAGRRVAGGSARSGGDAPARALCCGRSGGVASDCSGGRSPRQASPGDVDGRAQGLCEGEGANGACVIASSQHLKALKQKDRQQ